MLWTLQAKGFGFLTTHHGSTSVFDITIIKDMVKGMRKVGSGGDGNIIWRGDIKKVWRIHH